MELETFRKAEFILDHIKQIKFQIKHWSEISIYQVIDSYVLERIECEKNFEIFREGIVLKLKEHKRMLEEELAKL